MNYTVVVQELQRLKALYADTYTRGFTVPATSDTDEGAFSHCDLILRTNKTNITDKLLEMLFSLKVAVICSGEQLKLSKV